MEFVCWLVKIERVIHIIVATTIMTQCYVVVFPSLALLRQFYESHTCSLRPTLRECQVKALDACSQDKPVVNISMCTGAGKSRVISECLPSDGSLEYYATDGTLPGIPRVSASAPGDVILTTYISAPLVYRILSGLDDPVDVHVIHDEAHHITSPIYKESYDTSVGAGLIQKVINFSATLPEEYECDYTYPLLRGIKDGVVRDFNIKAIACLSGDNEQSFVDIVNLSLEWARSQGQSLRLLVYTSEANTDNEVDTEGGTSVRSFIEYLRKAARENDWWMRGLYSDTMGEREDIIWEFGNTKPVSGISILVSCRTLSEGVDLRNANAMLPWDPSSNAKTNIQRIGRILRKLKSASGEYLPSEQQTPSLVIVPVWLQRESYLELRGDSKAIHEQLYKDIAEGTRGSFAPLLNVTAALKSELTLDDDELFRQIINFPSRPKSGTLTGNVLEVVARSLKKKPADIVREMGECDVLDKDTCEVLREWVAGSKEDKEGLWEDIPEDVHGDVLDALVASQDLTLLVEQEKGGEPEVFGNGSVQKTLERKPDGTYAVSRRKRETPAEKKAKKEVQKRVSMCATDSYRVILGVADGAFEDGQSLVRLTTRIELDSDNEFNWNQRFEAWKAHSEKVDRTPLKSDVDDAGNNVGTWQDSQRANYKKGKLSQERIDLLSSCKHWKWGNEDRWGLYFGAWKAHSIRVERTPLTSDVDDAGNKVGSWQDTQRGDYKKGKLSQERIDLLSSCKHWKWEAPPRPRKRTKKSSSKKISTTVSPPSHKYPSSEFTDLHKKFKSMNSATYSSYIKEHPEEWEAYHAIADQYDARDDPEHSPHHRVPNFIQGKGYPASTPMVDLGCGRDRLRDDKRVSHLDWTSVDAVPASERVVQADLGSLPIDDNTFRLAVIIRALWARKPDYLQQLKEALRVIQQGGILVLCESRRKWIEEEKLECDSDNPRTVMVNHLYNAVTSVGFVVITQSKPDDASVWQFLVCQKPVVGGI